MTWPVDSVLADFAAPVGYELVHAAPSDVPALVAFLHESYPEVAVGSEAVHLDPAFYAANVFLHGGNAEAPLIALLARPHGEARLVAALTLERHPSGLGLFGRLGAVAPDHRSAALGLLGPRMLEAFGRAMGAGIVEYYATLKSRHQQVIAERLGFDPIGIIPASDLDADESGKVHRVYEVLYAKVLAPPEEMYTPDPEAMTARTRALYKQLFGG